MKAFFYLCIIVIMISCGKNDTPVTQPPATPTKILRLNSIWAVAPSGADLYYNFSYKDSLITKIVYHNRSAGDSITYVFSYNGSEISTIDFYYNDPQTSKTPYTRLAVDYTNNRISHVAFFYNLNDSLLLSTTIQYNYDAGGRMIGKKNYSIISGETILNNVHAYIYDSNNNIVKLTSESLRNGDAIEFDNSFDTTENVFFKNNPAMFVFYWYLFDMNQLVDGFPEVQMYSRHNLVSTSRGYVNATKEIKFSISLTQDNLWSKVLMYPNVYDDSNDLLFRQMNFSYEKR